MTPSPCTGLRRLLAALSLLGLGAVCAPCVAQSPSTAPSMPSRGPVYSGGHPSSGANGAGGYRRSPPLKPPARPTGDPRLAGFDSATRMLIEMELRTASPSEREHWLSLLATVQADQVPYLLNARRQAATGQNANASGQPAALSSPSVPSSAMTGPVTGHAAAATELPGTAPPQITRVSASTVPPAGTVPQAAPLAGAEAAPVPAASPTSLPVGPVTTPPATDAHPAETSPVAPQPQRRWMAPLRGRWGEGRGESEPGTSASIEPITTNTSPASRSSAYMNVELQRVMTLLRTELEEAEKSGLSPTDPRHRRLHVQMRLLHLLAEEPEQAVQAIPGLPSDQQEFWVQLLWAIANELDPPGDQSDADRLQRTATLLAEAERQLRIAAPLTLKNACFCHRINSFGSYDRFLKDEFHPGQPVLLYTEVQNFRSDLTGLDGYRTRLKTTIQIYPVGPDGQVPPASLPIDRREFPVTEDLCRSIRTDYFHSYRLDLPSRLPPGAYVLRLGMVDELAHRATSTEVPFVVR